ncbi:hypothetical protein [Streptomyces sp. NK08204]|uniref:hypothetical protein n=1 Tax=Streptomyces sp. NK08204 TaxID=2873260 RepID=UPI001CEDA4C3|nr:hypothetical protein [Streptomyces sp. NK08204]
MGAVAAAVALPLAVASAGQVGDAGPTAVGPLPRGTDAEARPAAASGRPPLLLGVGLATSVRCGPELTSPGGMQAQTCVMTHGEETWARTYYRNATGGPVDSVLSLMGPAGRTVQTQCATGADDEPATCETPREHSRGVLDAYTAVAEFAAPAVDGPLLLRSGSNARNSEESDGSSQKSSQDRS